MTLADRYWAAQSNFLLEAIALARGKEGASRGKAVELEGQVCLLAEQAREEGFFLPLETAMECSGAQGLAGLALLLAFVCQMEPAVSAALGEEATPLAAARLYGALHPQEADGGALLSARWLRTLAVPSELPPPLAPMRLTRRAFDFLREGMQAPPPAIASLTPYFPYEQNGEGRAIPKEEHADADATLAPLLAALRSQSEDDSWLMMFQTPGMVARERYIERLAHHLDVACLHVDAFALKRDFEACVGEILQETSLYAPLIAIHNVEELMPTDGEEDPLLYDLLSRLEGSAQFVVFTGELAWRPMRPVNRQFFLFSTASLPILERTVRWRALLPPQVDAASLAYRFDLDARQMRDAFVEATTQCAALGAALDDKAVFSACYHQVSSNLSRHAQLIRPRYQWGDLILAPATMNVLKQACSHVNHRELVLEEWGFQRMLPYGRSVSLVFMGPPGTGKTMAAQVLANQLNYEIYRVDISQMVSKYVGETEKNLDAVFAEAAKVGVILFFDEADALFARRTEVKDSHDKYANMESGFLLQRVEDYDGLVILATNHMGNMDEAFVRRMTFVVRFSLPDVACRKRMWREMLPAGVPREGLDEDFLAESFEFSGSDIKTILLHAAFGAAEEGAPMDMGHIARAVRYHHEKIGKTFMASSFGPYAELLK